MAKKREVYEYFIDDKNFILSWQTWPEEKKPELKNNPKPLPQMNDSIKDENGRLWLVKTNKNFKLESNNINIVAHEKSNDEKFDLKYGQKECLRRLVKGITNPLDPDFIEFVNDLSGTVRK